MSYWNGFGFLGESEDEDEKRYGRREFIRAERARAPVVGSKNPDIGVDRDKKGNIIGPAAPYRPKGQEAFTPTPGIDVEAGETRAEYRDRLRRIAETSRSKGRGISRGTTIQRKHDTTQELEAAANWRLATGQDLPVDEIAQLYRVGNQFVKVPEEVQNKHKGAVQTYILRTTPRPADVPEQLFWQQIRDAAEGPNELDRAKKSGDRPLPGKMTSKGELIIPPSLRDSLIRAERDRKRRLTRDEAYEFFLLDEGKKAQSITNPDARARALRDSRARAEKRADALMDEYKSRTTQSREEAAEAEFLEVDVERVRRGERAREINPTQLSRKDEKALVEARRMARREAQGRVAAESQQAFEEEREGRRTATPGGGYMNPVAKMRMEARLRAKEFEKEEEEANVPAALRRSRSMSGLGGMSGGTMLLGILSVGAVVGGIYLVYRTMQPKAA